MRVQSLRWEDPLEGMATRSSILVENPVDRGAWRATVHGVAPCKLLEEGHFHHNPKVILLLHFSIFLSAKFLIRLSPSPQPPFL